VLQLHHFPASTCSQKVRLVLEEKDLPFESIEVNILAGEQHDPRYVKLNPMHVVPTLIHDGKALIESSLIIRYLDDAFPDPAMRPGDPFGRYETDLWLKRVDETLHPAAPVVTFALGPRQALLAQPAEVREASLEAMPDPKARAIRRSVIEHGVQAPEFIGALRIFIGFLDEMEQTLTEGGDWISGERFGLVDATLVPYVLRLEHMGLDPLLDPELRPGVAEWLARSKGRPSFTRAVEAWIEPSGVERMRSVGKTAWREIEALLENETQPPRPGQTGRLLQ
jgi:glutathione S-transferase